MRIFFILLALLFSAPTRAAEKPLILAATTTLKDSGFLNYLLPLFTRRTGVAVKTTIHPTTLALAHAKRGDADILITHDKDLEDQFVEETFGAARYDVMKGEYVLVGPEEDPFHLSQEGKINDGMRKLAFARVSFYSRADNSGTHRIEMRIWSDMGMDPTSASSTWYKETGVGMAATIQKTIEGKGYTLAERGTWLATENKAGYAELVRSTPPVENQYGLIMMNPRRFPQLNHKAADIFREWLLGADGQKAIAGFRADGVQPYTPNASK